MQISESGLDIIKAFEGYRLSAYQDSVGIWTIGYGSTQGVHVGMVITAAQAEAMLRDSAVTFQSFVTAVVKQPISQKMFDALVSFTYNVGQGNLQKSSVLRLLNIGDYQSSGDAFLLWNKAGGQVVAGLVRRRGMERALFLSGIADLQTPAAPVAAPVEAAATPDVPAAEAPVAPAENCVVADIKADLANL
jgi:lysozyme